MLLRWGLLHREIRDITSHYVIAIIFKKHFPCLNSIEEKQWHYSDIKKSIKRGRCPVTNKSLFAEAHIECLRGKTMLFLSRCAETPRYTQRHWKVEFAAHSSFQAHSLTCSLAGSLVVGDVRWDPCTFQVNYSQTRFLQKQRKQEGPQRDQTFSKKRRMHQYICLDSQPKCIWI